MTDRLSKAWLAILAAAAMAACSSSDAPSGTNTPAGGSPGVAGGAALAGGGGLPGASAGAAGNATAGFGTGGGLPTAGAAGAAGAGGAAVGGASAGGSAGMAAVAGAAGAAGAPGPDNGYVSNGTWKGYAFTAASGAGTTVMPANFSLVKSNEPLCASGTVGNTTSSVAMVGINLNQAMGQNPAAGSVTPAKEGVIVSVTNTGASPLRLQIQGPNGATSATDRWCAPIPGNGGFIPWKAFNTACWDNTGTFYANQPVVAALIMVPGVITGNTAYNFCVKSVGEGDDPNSTGGTTGCSLTGSTGEGTATLTGQYEARLVTSGGKNYYVQNNVWGNASSNQSLGVNGVAFTVNQQSASNGTSGAPVSFPSVFIGSNGGHSTTGSNLPKLVSSLTTVPTGWSITTGVNGVFNATYDVWFSSGSGGDNGAGQPSGAYLMVWFYKPSTAQPIGSVKASAVSISGSSWDIWYGGTQNGVPVISYVRTSATTSLSFDLNVFIKDAVTNRPGTIKNTMALTNVFAGFEIWSGGAGLKTNNFCAIVN